MDSPDSVDAAFGNLHFQTTSIVSNEDFTLMQLRMSQLTQAHDELKAEHAELEAEKAELWAIYLAQKNQHNSSVEEQDEKLAEEQLGALSLMNRAGLFVTTSSKHTEAERAKLHDRIAKLGDGDRLPQWLMERIVTMENSNNSDLHKISQLQRSISARSTKLALYQAAYDEVGEDREAKIDLEESIRVLQAEARRAEDEYKAKIQALKDGTATLVQQARGRGRPKRPRVRPPLFSV
jgi:hypothetical protein